uniref:LD39177p n=1 Tax=Drosophila melanogaster TaxID=7227 RepID=Q8T020_DROME|nr:LD39177p [Drosophila melanogaster]
MASFLIVVEKMEIALFANAKKLYDHKLYECVIPAADLLRTVLKNDRYVATLDVEYQVLLYLLNANYKERNYRAALRHFDEIIHKRRLMMRHKNAVLVAIESSYPEFGDAEQRRRAAECYRQIGNTDMAIETLLQVPPTLRSPRINLMLARLQHHGSRHGTTKKSEAVLAYKEVIRECPMALQVIEALLELGVNGNEINSLVMHAATVPDHFDWLSKWIKALAQMFNFKHSDASQTFLMLHDNTTLRCNEHLMMALGKCLYYNGDYFQAEDIFSSTLCANPDNVEAIGLMAVLCGQEGGCEQDSADMDYLFAKVSSEVKYTASHWFAHAQLLYDEGKFERGLNFVEKCLDSEPRNHEALILRGRLLIALERHTQAVCAFRTAQMVAPYRFEIYRGLFHSYLAQKRFKEANALCNWTIRLFQNSPRSFTMFGRTLFLFPDPRMRRTARKFAEKSLKINHIYTPAVNLIADICQVEGPTKAIIKLLEKHVIIFPKVNLLNHLGDIMRKQKEPVKAMEYYYKALRQDPKSKRTLRGLRLLAKSDDESPVLDESDDIGMDNQQSINDLTTLCEATNAQGAEGGQVIDGILLQGIASRSQK